MFRPQFSYSTPKGYKDFPYVLPVTFGQNVTVSLLAGRLYQNFLIQTDNDAPSILRSLFWQGVQQAETDAMQIQLRDAYGNYLTDGYIPLWLYAWGAGNTTPDGGSGRAKVFEPELFCPPGSVLILDYFNASTATTQLPGNLEFRGVKRYPEVCQ